MVPVIPPSPNLIREAVSQFDSANELAETTLKELFGHCHKNQDAKHILIKVIVLNRLYSTQIFDVESVALHIYEHRNQIDEALAHGSPHIVKVIAEVEIKGKQRNNHSFASKFCSWHNQREFPIYDSRVDSYLWRLQKQEHFSKSFSKNDDLWEYPKFRTIIMDLKMRYQLEDFSFKEIDKFLWRFAREDPAARTSEAAES